MNAFIQIVNTELANEDNEVQALGMLKRACMAIRGGPRAELAAHVVTWEGQLDRRLRELGVDPADLHRSPTRRILRRRRAAESTVTMAGTAEPTEGER